MPGIGGRKRRLKGARRRFKILNAACQVTETPPYVEPVGREHACTLGGIQCGAKVALTFMKQRPVERHQTKPGIGRFGLVQPGAAAGKITRLDSADPQQSQGPGIAGPVGEHGLAQGAGPGKIIGQAQLPGLSQPRVLHHVVR